MARNAVPGFEYEPDIKGYSEVALAHALLSYLYGAVIVALVINVVSTLLH